MVGCFIGYISFDGTEKQNKLLCNLIEDLIINKGVCNFLDGGINKFNTICTTIVYILSKKYANINLVHIGNKANNFEVFRKMIDKSDYCIFYCDDKNEYIGTVEMAYKYALNNNKKVVNVYQSRFI